MNNDTYMDIRNALEHARNKHPEFTQTSHHSMVILMGEVGKIAQAMNDQLPQKVNRKIMDTIAVLIRMYEGD